MSTLDVSHLRPDLRTADPLPSAGAGSLTIPDVSHMTIYKAALAYAAAGMYLLPTDPNKIKNPGSVVGSSWQEKSSRDPEQIAEWFEDNPERGIAWHVGRSGAIAFDLDRDEKPEDMNGEIWDALQTGNVHGTRKNGTVRAHYVFACEPDQFGNSAGFFEPFGQVRCNNGVVILAPTRHPDADTKGGFYRWRKTGKLRPIPDVLRARLKKAGESVEPKTPAELDRFFAAHTLYAEPQALHGYATYFQKEAERRSSRHDGMRETLRFGFREAIAGRVPASEVYESLKFIFYGAKPEAKGTPEFREIACWAAAKAERDKPPQKQNGCPGGGGDEQPGTPSKFTARLLTRSDLKTLPNPEPLVTNVVDQGTTALLYGKWGTGKSFIALDWSMCVATGKTWQTRTTEQRKILYVAAEGAHGIKLRVNAWEKAWSSRVSDDWFHVLPIPVNLTNISDISEIVTLVKDTGYGMVIFDTLARCMVGADENSAKDAGVVINTLTEVKEATADGMGLVLGVHHTGKDAKTLRGSSAFESGVDTVYYTSVENGRITLEREKRKDGPVDDVHKLRIEPVDGTESAVVSLGGVADSLTRADRLFAIICQKSATSGIADAQLKTFAQAAGMSERTYMRGRDDLLKDGRVVNIGTAKKKLLVMGPTA